MIVRELQIFLRYLQRGLLKTPEFVKLVLGMITTLEGPEKLLCELREREGGGERGGERGRDREREGWRERGGVEGRERLILHEGVRNKGREGGRKRGGGRQKERGREAEREREGGRKRGGGRCIERGIYMYIVHCIYREGRVKCILIVPHSSSSIIQSSSSSADPKYYAKTITAPNPKVWTNFLAIVMKVGQIQLIRRQIHREMNRTCKFDSKLLANSLQALNQ